MVESSQPAIWRSRQFTVTIDGGMRIVGFDLPWILCCF